MEKEKLVTNISEYVQTVCELKDAIEKESLLHQKELLFRGQSNKEYPLLPSIGRNRQFDCQCTIFNEERNLIEMAKYKMPDIFNRDMTPVELLALLQHHGIPTRLLDVTENALVALFFACFNLIDSGKDGEVIVFNRENNDVTNYPIINAIADSYRFSRGTWRPLSSFYADVKRQPYFLEQQYTISTVIKDDKAGGEWIARCCNELLYIYAPIRSMRQQVQHGRYILFPNHIGEGMYDEKHFSWKIDEIPKEHEDIIMRIIIPSEKKKKMLTDLEILGITESFLFCDNIDKVCEGIVSVSKRRI